MTVDEQKREAMLRTLSRAKKRYNGWVDVTALGGLTQSNKEVLQALVAEGKVERRVTQKILCGLGPPLTYEHYRLKQP